MLVWYMLHKLYLFPELLFIDGFPHMIFLAALSFTWPVIIQEAADMSPHTKELQVRSGASKHAFPIITVIAPLVFSAVI